MFVHLALIVRDLQPKKKKIGANLQKSDNFKNRVYSIPTFLIRICVLDKASVP